MLRNFQLVIVATFVCLFAGCQGGASKKVEPKFGIQTLTMIGALKFEHGTNVTITDVFMRMEEPGKFELVASKGPNDVFCHFLADKENWQIEFPAEKRTHTGHGPPSDEQLAVWVETQRMVVTAIKRAQVVDELSEVVRGAYDNGRHYTMELSEFRNVMENIFATRMKLTCRGCQTSIEIKLRDLK